MAPFLPPAAILPKFAVLGLTGVWAGQGLGALALANLPPTVFAVLQPLQPVITLGVAVALGHEALSCSLPSAGMVAGLLATVGSAAGVVLSTAAGAGGDSSASGSLPLGLAYVLLQVLLGGAYAAAQKGVLVAYKGDSLYVAAWGYAVGTTMLALCAVTGATTADAWTLSPLGWGAVAFSGLIGSGCGYAALAAANARTSPLIVMAFSPLQPMATGVLLWLVKGETLTTAQLGFGGGICAGLLLTLYSTSLSHRASAKALRDDEDAEALLSGDGERDKD